MINLLLSLIKKYQVIVKFIIAGGTATFTDLVFLYFFHSLCNIQVVISATLAFLIAFFVSFFLQKFWTFGDKSKEKIKKQMAIYFIVGLTNTGVNAEAMYLLVVKEHVWYLLAQILISALIACYNFLVYKYFIFKYIPKTI